MEEDGLGRDWRERGIEGGGEECLTDRGAGLVVESG